jgi:hypothetical protein
MLHGLDRLDNNNIMEAVLGSRRIVHLMLGGSTSSSSDSVMGAPRQRELIKV